MPDTIERARWWPRMPPMLPNETPGQYTGRLTGADRTNRVPYDHRRNRQCSIGYHEECSERSPGHDADRGCECPCHTQVGQLEYQVDDLEEALVAAWSLIAGTRTGGRGEGISDLLADRINDITTRHPEFGRWYLSEDGNG